MIGRKVISLVSIGLMVLVLAALPVLGGCAKEAPVEEAAPAEKEVIEWTMLAFSPETHTCFQWMGRDFADAVNKATDGRLVITPHAGGSLVPEVEYLSAIKEGAADIMMVCATYYVGTMPVTNFEYGFPGTYRQPSDYYIHYEKFGFRDILERAYAEQGIKWLGYATDSGIPLLTTKPVSSIEDLAALKIRASGGAALTLQELGASVTWIPGGELYTSLATGVIDGVIYGSVDSLDSLGLQEVGKYVIFPKLIGAHMPITYAANMDSWNKLPDDLKAIVETTVKSKLHDYYDPCIYLEKIRLQEWESEYGIEVMELSEEEFAKIGEAALTVMEGLAAEDPYCAEAFESVKEFMEFMGY